MASPPLAPSHRRLVHDLQARAILVAMANEWGRVVVDHHRSGKARVRLDFGVVDLGEGERQRVRVRGRPNPMRPWEILGFSSTMEAEVELEIIRAAVKQGYSQAAALSPYLPRELAKDRIEVRVDRHLERWRELVAQGKRSPTSLREIKRYAAPGGPWSWWYGRTVWDLRAGDVEDWHLWLGQRAAKGTRAKPGQTLGPKTQRNISDAFRAFLRSESRRDEGRIYVPHFPALEVSQYAARTITTDRMLRILDAIPWERRGAFLVIAFEQVRVSEAVAFQLEDWDGEQLHLHRGRQGHTVGALVRHNKTRSAVWRRPWWPELVEWIEWRVRQTPAEERLAGRETALFWSPGARNEAKAWSESALRRQWRKACAAVGEEIALQEGTRHTVTSRLAEVLSQATLQKQTRHRSSRSLEHYTVGARPDPVAMVRAIRPKEDDGD